MWNKRSLLLCWNECRWRKGEIRLQGTCLRDGLVRCPIGPGEQTQLLRIGHYRMQQFDNSINHSHLQTWSHQYQHFQQLRTDWMRIHALSTGKNEVLRSRSFLQCWHHQTIYHNHSLCHRRWNGYGKFERNPALLQAKREDNTQSDGSNFYSEFFFVDKISWIILVPASRVLLTGWW